MSNMAQAIRMALHYAESNYDLKDVYGQDVGAPLGGVFTATQGLKKAWNSTLDEFHVVFNPCVAVKTPPKGMPTSCPKISFNS